MKNEFVEVDRAVNTFLGEAVILTAASTVVKWGLIAALALVIL
jgi:hypothetical protein